WRRVPAGSALQAGSKARWACSIHTAHSYLSSASAHLQDAVLHEVGVVIELRDLPRPDGQDASGQLAVIDLAVAAEYGHNGGVHTCNARDGGVDLTDVDGLPKGEV